MATRDFRGVPSAVYPVHGEFWMEFASSGGVALSNGFTDYYYPSDGNGNGTTTNDADALWGANKLNLSDFVVIVTRITAGIGAGDSAVIMPVDGVWNDADAYAIGLAVGAHDIEVNLQFDGGFRAVMITGSPLNQARVHFRLLAKS